MQHRYAPRSEDSLAGRANALSRSHANCKARGSCQNADRKGELVGEEIKQWHKAQADPQSTV